MRGNIPWFNDCWYIILRGLIIRNITALSNLKDIPSGLLEELLQDLNASITTNSVLFNSDYIGLLCSKYGVYTALSTHTVDEKLLENSDTQISAASLPETLAPPMSRSIWQLLFPSL